VNRTLLFLVGKMYVEFRREVGQVDF
jgi:hypothetical protein